MCLVCARHSCALSVRNGLYKKIKIYDTQEFQDTVAAYDQALEDGADFVVGPLLQESVNNLAKKIAFSVPVLTLNSLDNDESLIRMYQFSLSSVDEAISTSNKVIIDQNKIGLIIAPDNEWGHRLEEIYTTTYTHNDVWADQVGDEDIYYRKL